VKQSLDELSQALNGIIILGEDNWKTLLLAMMSPYAPRIPLSGVEVRNNLHTLLVGDSGSAKTQTLNVIKKVAPKWESISKASEPSLEGSAVTKTIKPGILETASDGILLVSEFQSAYYSHTQILREALDCSEIRIFKKGESRIYTPNVTLMANCNPSDDFFQQGLKLREQVKFKEGILSRFDVLIPLLVSPELNEQVLERLVLFGRSPAGVEWKSLQDFFQRRSKLMSNVQQTGISVDQEACLKDVFKKHNRRRQLDKRPFLTLRDVETLMRLLNTLTAFENTVSTRVVNPSDAQLEVAIGLWEHLLALRQEFYSERIRRVLTISQQILQYVETKGGSSKVEDVKAEICDDRKLCSTATLYRKLNRLEEQGRISHKKGPEASVQVIVVGSYLE